MNEIRYGNFKIGCNTLYYLQMNIKVTRKNVTNYFRINVRFVFVYAKTTLSTECQKNVATRLILTELTASVFHRI